MGGSRSLTLPVVTAPLGVCIKAPPPRRSVAYCTRQSVCRAKDHGPSSPSPVLAKLPGPSDMLVTHPPRVRGGPRSVTPLQAPPPPRPPFACFDWLRVLAHSVLLWLRLHRVSTSSYLPTAFPTSCVPRLLAVLSGIILSFFSAVFLFPATDQQCCLQSIPRTLSCPKPIIPSLVIAESACYMRNRR